MRLFSASKSKTKGRAQLERRPRIEVLETRALLSGTAPFCQVAEFSADQRVQVAAEGYLADRFFGDLGADSSAPLNVPAPNASNARLGNLLATAVGPLPLAGFVNELVANDGLSQPIAIDFLPDGRMLVLEKEGRILIMDPDTGQRQTYLTLQNIDSGGEKGLLDIAIDPNFDPSAPGPDYIYLYYTPASPARARIARFVHNELSGGLTSRARRGSELEVWRDTDPYLSCCHYGGGLDFGPDGKLWLTTADKFTAPNPGEGGTNENLPQNLTSASGKVIRINSDGSIPDGRDGWPANPFLDPRDDDPALPGRQDYLDSIWAYGLRNPFRASWDLPTGRFFIAEVGGNVKARSHEDVHVASLESPGVNFGWPYYEGTNDLQMLDPRGPFAPPHGFGVAEIESPIFSLPHNRRGASITGGDVYRGSQFPPAWQGVYFYGDYTRDTISYLTFDAQGRVTGSYPFLPTGALPNVPNQVVDIRVGNDGALYYVLIGGAIRRVRFEGGNRAPEIANLAASPGTGTAPLRVAFSAVVTDPEQARLNYVWRFGDGSTAAGTTRGGTVEAVHTYAANGTYQVFLEVSDGNSTAFSRNLTIQVGRVNAPPQVTTLTANPASGDPPLRTTLRARITDPEGDPLRYQWVFGDGSSTGFRAVPASGEVVVSRTYREPGSYAARLIVRDGVSEVASDPVTIVVGTSDLPPVVDGLVVLLESDIKLALLEGNTVAAWLDGSGNGNNLTAQGNPQVAIPGTPSGLPAVVFDGRGDKLVRLASESLNGIPGGNEDRTMIVVANYQATQGIEAGVAYGAGGLNQTFGLTADGGTGRLAVQGWGNRNDRTSSAPGVSAGWIVQSVVLGNSQVRHYRDGDLIDAWRQVYQTNLQAADSQWVIGGEIANLGFNRMSVAAVLLYDRALTDLERSQVEAYLQGKYLGGNAPPRAEDDVATVVSGGETTIDVLANDADSDGVLNPNSLTIVAGPTHGTVTRNPQTGVVTYRHDGSTNRSDSFTYRVRDEVGALSNIATVTLTIRPSGETPSLVSRGLVVRFDAEMGVATTPAGRVTGWLDASGRGNDLQSAIGNPRLVASATPNGSSAIRFDGDDSLAREGADDPLNGLATGNADRTLLVVARYDAATAYAGVAYGNGRPNQAFGAVVVPGTGRMAVQAWGAGDEISSVPGIGTGWLIQTIVVAGGLVRHFRDGELIDEYRHTFATGSDRLVIGSEIAGLGFADFDVAAALIYDRALNAQERTTVEAYLEAKFLR
jgi:glucose/arabinose dehydrogenase/PKD repeat protein